MNFNFVYSSFPTFYNEVDLKGNKLLFKKKYGEQGEVKIISLEKLSEFWTMISMMRLEYWKENYNSCVLDGLQWSVKIDSDFLKKEVLGSNEFPDGSCTLKNTPIFDKLIAAVEYLIEEQHYFKNL
jgi:hypothetical protein